MIARLLPWVLVAGCAGGPVAVPAPTVGTRPRDPAPTSDEPRFRAPAGETTALRLSSGHGQAAAIALAFVLDASRHDEAALVARLADRVARLRPRVGARVEAREGFSTALLRWVESHGGPVGDSLEDLVVVSRLSVEPLGAFLDHAEVPEGLEPTDLVVRIPFALSARLSLRGALPSWNEDLILLVRPGPEPLVVGL